jgi:hypothetical protein
LEKIQEFKFSKKAQVSFTCAGHQCGYKGAHEVIDKLSKEVKDMSLTFWNPREILVHYEETYSTLLFASRAMNVRTNAFINEKVESKITNKK